MRNYNYTGGLKIRGYVIVAFALMAALLLVLCGCEDKEEKIRQGMKAYLEDRYGIEFVVGKLYISGDGGAARYRAKTHPKGNPQIEFVVEDKENMEKSGPVEYGDWYLNEKWNYQGKLEVEKKIKEIYGANASFVVNRYVFGGGGYKHRDLDHNQVLEEIRGERRSSGHLEYTIFVDEASFNKEEEAQKAYAILKAFYLDYGFTDSSFFVTFIDKADMKDYLSNPKPYEDQANRNFFEQSGFRHQYPLPNPKRILGRFMFAPDLNDQIYQKVKSGSDIIKYSKYQ
jgi:hypothetical protein